MSGFFDWGRQLLGMLPALDPHPPTTSSYAEAVLKVAIAEMGHGEEGGNNRGPDLDRYRRGIGAPGDPWCAAFVSFCLESGAAALGVPCPVKRSHSARRLFANVLAAGSRVERPAARDIVLWARGAANSGQGHIGIVSRVAGNTFWSVQGNKGGFPSRVREYLSELGEANLLGFGRLP